MFCDNGNEAVPNEAFRPQDLSNSLDPGFLPSEPLQCLKPGSNGVYNVAMASVQNQSERPGSEWGVYLFSLLLLLFTGNGLNNSWHPSATELFKRTDGGQDRTDKDGLSTIAKTREDDRQPSH